MKTMRIAGCTIWLIVISVMPQHAVRTDNRVHGSHNHGSTSSNSDATSIDFGSASMANDSDQDAVEVLSISDADPVTVPASDIVTMMKSTTSGGDIYPVSESSDGVFDVLSRDKRTLTYPKSSTLLLIFGLGTPLQLDTESVIVGVFTKMIYTLPTNSTDFTEPGVYFGRKKSRWSIYKVLERVVELYGFGAGKGCLLSAICEVAAAPFDIHHGLFGQMAQAFLSPSSTSEAYDEYRDREYHAAERLGRHVGQNCHALYPECERNVLDIFSTTATTSTTSPTTTTTKSVT